MLWGLLLFLGYVVAASADAEETTARARQRAEARVLRQVEVFETWHGRADAQIGALHRQAQAYQRARSQYGRRGKSTVTDNAARHFLSQMDATDTTLREGQRIRERLTRLCERMAKRWPVPLECEEEEQRELLLTWNGIWDRRSSAVQCFDSGEGC